MNGVETPTLPDDPFDVDELTPEEINIMSARALNGLDPIKGFVANPKELEDPTIGDKVQNAVNVSLRGLHKGLISTPLKLTAMAANALQDVSYWVAGVEDDKELKDYALYQWGKAVDDWVDKAAPSDPRLKESFVYETLPSAFTSFGIFFLAAPAGAAVGLGTKASVMMAGAGMESVDAYEKALERGADEADRLTAAAWGIPIGASEELVPGRIIKRLKNGGGSKITNALVDGGLEAAQEFAQTAAGEAVALAVYEKDKTFWDKLEEVDEQIAEATAAGGVVGGTVSVLAGLITGRRRFRFNPDTQAVEQNTGIPGQQLGEPTPDTPEGMEQVSRMLGGVPVESALPPPHAGQEISPAPPQQGPDVKTPGPVARAPESQPSPDDAPPRAGDAGPAPTLSAKNIIDDAASATDYAQRHPAEAKALADAIPERTGRTISNQKWKAAVGDTITGGDTKQERLAAAKKVREALGESDADTRHVQPQEGLRPPEGPRLRGQPTSGDSPKALAQKEVQRLPPEEQGQVEDETLIPPEDRTSEFGKMPAVSMSGRGKAASRGISKAKYFFKDMFKREGHMPVEAFDAKQAKDQKIRSMLTDMSFTYKDTMRAVKEEYGSKGPSRSDMKKINRVLQSKADLKTIPRRLRPHINKMRDDIDGLSNRLIALGIAQGDLSITIAENMGVYMTRSYRVFDDPNWHEIVPAAVVNKAVNFLHKDFLARRADSFNKFADGIRRSNPKLNVTEQEIRNMLPKDDINLKPMTKEEIDNEVKARLNALLRVGKASDGTLITRSLHGQGRMEGAKVLEILKNRKDIPKEIRELWGEYADEPFINYVRSVQAMSQIVANHEFLTEVRKAGLKGGWFFEKDQVGRDPEAVFPVAAEGSKAMEPLNGLMAREEVAKAFQKQYQSFNAFPVLRQVMRLNSMVKAGKTIYSPTTQIRNLTANTGFALANGHYQIWHAKEAMGVALTGLNVPGFREASTRDKLMYLQRKGVVSDNANFGELEAALETAQNRDVDEFIDKTLDSKWKSFKKKAGELYQAEDDVWKIYAFLNEQSSYRKAMPQWTQEQVDAEAARIVRNTYPTYSNIAKGVRAWGLTPVFGTFVSFPAEVIRVGGHTVGQAWKELHTPGLRAIGARRAAGIGAASIYSSGVSWGVNMMLGWAWDEIQDMREFFPEWMENSIIMGWGYDDEGNREFINVSHSDPWAQLKDALMTMIRGENFGEAIKDAALEFMDPFISLEIMTKAGLEAFTGRRLLKESRVWNPEEDWDKRYLDAAEHIWKAIQPGVVSSAGRIKKALEGRVEYGKKYDPVIETVNFITGVRVSTLDIPNQMKWELGQFRGSEDNVGRILTTVTHRSGTVGDAEIVDAYQRMEAARRQTFDKMARKVRAARRLGVSEGELVTLMRSKRIPTGYTKQGLPKATGDINMRTLLSGDYEPKVFSDRWLLDRAKYEDPKAFLHRRELIRNLMEQEFGKEFSNGSSGSP